MRALHPSWQPGGWMISHLDMETPNLALPPEAVRLPAFHLTLIGRKSFAGVQDELADAWDEVESVLSSPPLPDLDQTPHLAVDGSRRTWFLHVRNQNAFRRYVLELNKILDSTLLARSGRGFENPERDRYFHVSIANNQDGDPLRSIGSIQDPRNR